MSGGGAAADGPGRRYAHGYAPVSVYANVVRLVTEVTEPGLVLDLGCGHAAIAEPLVDAGWSYVGVDVDDGAVAAVRERGLEAAVVDLAGPGAAGALGAVVGDRRPVAVTALDALEHLPEPELLVAALAEVAPRWGDPALVVSIPNVTHFDLAAKLLTERWDVTETGLLDRTHLRFFDPPHLTQLFADGGWHEVGAADYPLHHSDQHFPPDHPGLADGTPLNTLLWRVRDRAGPHGAVLQYVRAFRTRPDDGGPDTTRTAAPPSDARTDESAPFLSVVVRTTGDRPDTLVETLTCLAAQDDDDLEVVLAVHHGDPAVRAAVAAQVADFPVGFAGRVRVLPVVDGGRAAPLNAGLAAARGRYVAFLDDDDLVTADWVRAFRSAADAAPGRVARSVTVRRPVARGGPGGRPYEPLGPVEMPYPERFDHLAHLYENHSPICSFAVPTDAVAALGLRFRDDLPVLEDWAFLVEAAGFCGVEDSRRRTAVYHQYREGGSRPPGAEDDWADTREAVLGGLDAGVVLLPPGSATRIGRLWHEHERWRAEVEHARGAVGDLAARADAADAARQAAERERDQARAELADVLGSRVWRAAAPVRWLRARLRRAPR